MTSSTHLHELSEDETRWSGTDQENLGTEWHLELVHSVDGARGGLEECRLLVGEVLDLVALGKVAAGVSLVLIDAFSATHYLM